MRSVRRARVRRTGVLLRVQRFRSGARLMGARAIWKGSIRFGAVEVPVKLYSAVQDQSISFRLLDRRRNEPVKQFMVDPASGKRVEYEQIQRAFETDTGELVLLEKSELEQLEPEPSRDIEITRFVEPQKITHQWYDRPYYLGPDDDDGAYFALAVALRKQDKEGVARWVMRKKEYVGALRTEGDYLMLITLRHAAEVVPASALSPPEGRDLEKREVAMAKQLIAAMEDEFDIAAYRDEYRARVLELVEAKAAGKVVRLPRARAKKTDRSLTEMLERSVAAAKKVRRSA
jgi:DNA end-binding protein Ku